MRFLSALISLTFSFQVFANNTITDSSQVLEQLGLKLPARSFDQALKCDSKASFKLNIEECEFHCSRDGGFTMCAAICKSRTNALGTRAVADCSADEVTVYADDGSAMLYTKAGFDQFKGNLLAEFIHKRFFEFIDHDGTLEIERLQPTRFTLARGTPGERKVEAFHVFAKYGIPGFPGEFDVVFTVIPEAPGVAQIARFRIGDKTWFLLEDY